MPLKVNVPKKIEPIDEDTKLIMETLSEIMPKNHPMYEKVLERSKAPVKVKSDIKP